MTSRKLVLIGAGSVSFTRGLIADVLLGLCAEGSEWTIALVDIDGPALRVAEGLARRMIEARDAPVTVEASLDRRDALPGAGFVVSTIGVGGRRAWANDVEIPRAHGVFQPVGDTVMAGGISRALRQIPPSLAIARDVRELCPDAFLFNYANPMAAICRAVGRATDQPIVGLCHGVQGTLRYLADVAGVAYEEIGSLYVGMNHLTWITHLTHAGEDLWPRVREGRAALDPMDNPFSWELFDSYGAFPAVLDRHVSEFFPECFPGGDYYGRKLGLEAFDIDGVIHSGDDHFERMAAQAEGRLALDESVFAREAGEHEALIPIIASIRSDARDVFPMNVPNRTVAGVPEGFVIETPVAASGAGCLPLNLPPVGPGVLATVCEALYGVEITVEAALTGDRDLVTQALLYDRCVTSRRAAIALADALIEANREHLPQFE